MPSVPKRASAATTASAKSTPWSGSSASNTRRSAKTSRDGRHVEQRGGRLGEHLAGPLGGLEGGVAHHQGDARGVAAEVDRGQVGVADAEADVGEGDAEHLGHHRRQHAVRALADLGLAAEDGDAAGAVELEHHARLRHVVPVDRQAGAAEIRAAGEAEPAPFREPAVALAPAAAGDHRLDAAAEAHRADLEPVGGHRVGRGEVPEAQVGGIDAQGVRRPCRGGSRRRSGAAACRGRAWGRTGACW